MAFPVTTINSCGTETIFCATLESGAISLLFVDGG